MLPTAEGKLRSAQNHRQIDARGKAGGIKAAISGILNHRARWVYNGIALWGRKVKSLFRSRYTR